MAFPWDPTEARSLLEWTLANGLGHLIYGFELGNEQVQLELVRPGQGGPEGEHKRKAVTAKV